jgi:cobalt/nickel transport system permease protein
MELWLDRYAGLHSPIHRWEARCRFVGLLSLIIACAMVNDLILLPALIIVAAGSYGAARLPLSFLVTRLRYPGVFVLAVIIVLPFMVGPTALAQVGPVTLYREGVTQAILTAIRFGCILTLSLVLFGTAPFLVTVRTMRALGVPGLLVDMILFFYRYLADTAQRLTTMQRALRLRGLPTHRLSRRLLSALAALTGTLLVQSAERSERVYQAMRLRGYGQATTPPPHTAIQPADWLGLISTLLLAAALVTLTLLVGG